MTTIVLADDHELLRRGLRALIESRPGCRVVAETGRGDEVPALVAAHRPDVLVIDLMMPGMSGLDVARWVRADVRVVLLSMHADEAYVSDALAAGALAYVLKGAGSDEILTAVQQVLLGKCYLSPPLTMAAVEAYRAQLRTHTDPLASLTAREREVLRLVVAGASNGQIAEQLTISPRTVESHCANLLRKLDLQSRFELIRFVIRHGLFRDQQS